VKTFKCRHRSGAVACRVGGAVACRLGGAVYNNCIEYSMCMILFLSCGEVKVRHRLACVKTV